MSYINPDDPLHKSSVAPDRGRELFSAFGRVASGFNTEDISSAAANLLVNAVRQNHATRSGAASAFEEVMTRARALLLEQHYDRLGNRRNVFPFHQTINVAHSDLRRT